MFGVDSSSIQLVALSTVAIFMEGFPFLLAGAMLSALFEVFVPERVFRALSPRNPLLAVSAGLGLSFFVPCCECGIVYVARRLVGKGLSPAAAITFMVAAPVLNPVVLTSTVVAFRGDTDMALYRSAVVAAIAVVLGLACSRFSAQTLLNPVAPQAVRGCGCAGGETPEGGIASAPGDALSVAELDAHGRPRLVSRLEHACRHALADFLEMAAILALGALITSVVKTLTPASWLLVLETDLVAAVAGMMILALVLSLCSQADAFVAASFVSFPFAAQLAFLTLGPLLDLKLAAQYTSVFRPAAVRRMMLIPVAMVFVLCLLIGRMQGN